MIDKQYEVDLWKKYNSGDQGAKVELLKSLDPLIQKQVNRFTASGLPRAAIETHARRLVLGSFDTYTPGKSAVATHATNHLKHLQRYVLEYQNVGKIPENRGLAISKFENIFRNLKEDLGREPDTTELADELKWDLKEVQRMQKELRKDLSIASFGENEQFFEDILHATDETEEIIQFIYFDSDPEDKLILEYSFGLAGKQQLAVKDIANKLNKPESYIRRKRAKIAERINSIRDQGLL